MINIVEEEATILKFYKRFQNHLSTYLNRSVDCWVGYPSGSFEDTVKYSIDLNIWLSTKGHDTKYWNGFGVGQPIENHNNSLNGEINFPISGIYRRVAGAFGIEDKGTILVLHRGKIGGGTKGIGKYFFTDNFRGDFVDAIDGDRESRFCVVGELESKHFPEQVANFIKEIHRVKQLIKYPEKYNFNFLNDYSFVNEHSGVTYPENQGGKTIERTHGIIVNALAEELKALGYKVANDRNRDLFTYSKSRVENLFEIKTNCGTQSLYTALGQLLIYSIPVPNDINLFMVIPTELKREVSLRLSELGIQIIYFNWEDDTPVFKELNKHMKIKNGG
ncbi:MAG: hypothetical protein H6567_05455 [Lewinellaceae bacterium]|nr:hypothetical protein [Lewinellaceae bacterium]